MNDNVFDKNLNVTTGRTVDEDDIKQGFNRLKDLFVIEWIKVQKIKMTQNGGRTPDTVVLHPERLCEPLETIDDMKVHLSPYVNFNQVILAVSQDFEIYTANRNIVGSMKN